MRKSSAVAQKKGVKNAIESKQRGRTEKMYNSRINVATWPNLMQIFGQPQTEMLSLPLPTKSLQ